jgi:hypothetical protein
MTNVTDVSDAAIADLLAEALRGLVRFVEGRPDDATADDEVRALEDVAYVLTRVTPEDRERLMGLLGDELSSRMGLV